MTDDLKRAIREVLEAPCGHKRIADGRRTDMQPSKQMIALRVRDCPTCLPTRVVAALATLWTGETVGHTFTITGALAALRGEGER